MKTRNERFSPRVSLSIPIQVRPEGKLTGLEEICMSENLSACGVCFVTHLPLVAGNLIEMIFIMPRELTVRSVTPFRYTGKVLRVCGLEGPEQSYRVAASLLWLTDVRPRKSRPLPNDNGRQDAA